MNKLLLLATLLSPLSAQAAKLISCDGNVATKTTSSAEVRITAIKLELRELTTDKDHVMLTIKPSESTEVSGMAAITMDPKNAAAGTLVMAANGSMLVLRMTRAVATGLPGDTDFYVMSLAQKMGQQTASADGILKCISSAE